MAKIIIQGSKEENSKAFKALKETFNDCEEKLKLDGALYVIRLFRR